MENVLEAERLRCEGFLGGVLGRRVLLPEVIWVSPAEIEKELHETVEDALQFRRRSPFRAVELWVEGRVLRVLAGRVLGIYTQRISGNHESRILLSRETLDGIAAGWGVREESLLRWVLSHEAFHAVQLHPGSPLRAEMQLRARALVQGKGNLAELLAAMTWIEGSADWVMDLPGLLSSEEVGTLRQKMIERRGEKSFSIWMKLLRIKRNQYERGRTLAERAWQEVGPSSLLLPVENPELLPRSEETPEAWSERLGRAALL